MGRPFNMNFEELLRFLKKDVGPTLENSVHDYTSKAAIDKLDKLFTLKNKVILDIGCGLGRDIFYMESLGARCYGITTNAEELSKINHRRVYSYDMHDLHLFSNYDIIFASHVLEHSPCPLLVLKNFYYSTTPEGIVYIEVPSPQPWSIHNQNHYSVFCKDMWLELFDKAGFTCIEQTNLKINIETDTGKIEDEFWGFILKKKNA